MTVANKMRNYGENMPDIKVVEKNLHSLTEKFDYILCSIEESKNIDLSIDDQDAQITCVEIQLYFTSLMKLFVIP